VSRPISSIENWWPICTKNITRSSTTIRRNVEFSESIGRSSSKPVARPLKNENARMLPVLLLIYRCAQIRAEPDPDPCPKRMFNVHKNFLRTRYREGGVSGDWCG